MSTETLFTEQANDFDAVVIDANPSQAASFAKAATALGKPTLVGQLPGGLDVLGQTDALLMPAHTWRFLPSIQTVKRSIDAGKLGEPCLLRIHRWLPPESTTESIAKRILPDTDLACWMFGGAPEKIWTLQSAANPEYIQFHLGFTNDGMAMIDITGSLPADDGYFSLSMIGGTGAAYADDHHNMNLLYSGGQPNALRTNQGRTDLTGQLQEFVDAISEQREAAVTPADTSNVVQSYEPVPSGGQLFTVPACAVPYPHCPCPCLCGANHYPVSLVGTLPVTVTVPALPRQRACGVSERTHAIGQCQCQS